MSEVKVERGAEIARALANALDAGYRRGYRRGYARCQADVAAYLRVNGDVVTDGADFAVDIERGVHIGASERAKGGDGT